MHQWRILYYTEEHINPWSLSAQKFVLSEAAQAHVGDFKLSRTRTRQRLTYRKPSETFPTKLLHLFRSAFHLPSFKHHIGLQTEKKKKGQILDPNKPKPDDTNKPTSPRRPSTFSVCTASSDQRKHDNHLLLRITAAAPGNKPRPRGDCLKKCHCFVSEQVTEAMIGINAPLLH